MKEEVRIYGACSCGRPVVKVINSRVPTCRVDGTRYAYPETIDKDRWCIFRCRSCEQPIDETFREPAAIPPALDRLLKEEETKR